MSRQLPILLYHRIDHSGRSTATAPQMFREHLRHLAEKGWRTISLRELEAYSEAGRAFPERRFILSFDDGYDNIFHTALPIMQEFGYSGVAFISTKFIGQQEAANGTQNDEEDGGFLTWEQIRAMHASGAMEFQSHTHTHRDFKECTPTELAEDLLASISVLSRELRVPRHSFKHLAWPWGASTQEWRNIASHLGFSFQYTVARASFQKDASLLQIPRACFDGRSTQEFQRQFWLQTGALSPQWHAMYGLARSAKQIYRTVRGEPGKPSSASVKARLKKQAPMPPLR